MGARDNNGVVSTSPADVVSEGPLSISTRLLELRRGLGSSSNRNSIVSSWFKWHKNCQAMNSQAEPRLSLSPQSSSVSLENSHLRILATS